MNVLLKIVAAITVGIGLWLGWQQFQLTQCGEYKGLKCQNVSLKKISQWQRNPNLMAEINNNQLYLQEDVSAAGGEITSPAELPNNFILKFEFEPLAAESRIDVRLVDRYYNVTYAVGIDQTERQTILSLYKGNVKVGENILTPLQQDLFYEFALEKIANSLTLYLDKGPVIQTVDPDEAPNGKMVISVQGKPNKPAGIVIRKMQFYK